MQEKRLHSFKNVIFITTIFCCLIYRSHCDECVDVSNPQIRSFTTLLDFQANRVSFKVDDAKFGGNYIAIQENFANISRNSFISYTSEYIVKLFLNNHRIQHIEEGAFISLNCLTVLDLQHNSLSKITKRMFEGLPILRELNLADNSLAELPELVFSLIPNLQVLNLTRNVISILESGSFYNLSRLEQLDLSYNKIHEFVPDIFEYLQHLTNLQLGSNKLDRPEFELWNLPHLRTLNLSNNLLESFDTFYNFIYGTTLKELYLDGNCLTQINSYGLSKHFSNLSKIGVDNNPWMCSHLDDLIASLKKSSVSFKSILTNTSPSVEGIACNRSLETCMKHNAEDTEKTTEAINTTTLSSNKVLELALEKVTLNNQQLLESTHRLNIIVALLFAIVIIYILVDVGIRSGMLKVFMNFKNCGGSCNRNSSETVENVSLLLDQT